MNDISSEWFYDSILLKYPSVVFKYRSWFEHIKPDVIPDGNDMIKLKQWQIALMIQAERINQMEILKFLCTNNPWTYLVLCLFSLKMLLRYFMFTFYNKTRKYLFSRYKV